MVDRRNGWSDGHMRCPQRFCPQSSPASSMLDTVSWHRATDRCGSPASVAVSAAASPGDWAKSACRAAAAEVIDCTIPACPGDDVAAPACIPRGGSATAPATSADSAAATTSLPAASAVAARPSTGASAGSAATSRRRPVPVAPGALRRAAPRPAAAVPTLPSAALLLAGCS